MNNEFDDVLRSNGIYFLPWIGDNYKQGFCGRSFLVLGESHYSCWDGSEHDLQATFTRECVHDAANQRPGARFWKNTEQALLNERRQGGRCPSGGFALWNRFAFYNFVQSPVSGGPRSIPTVQQFDDSLAAFATVLGTLRPERVLVCGKRLWKQMDRTTLQLHDYVQAYELSNGSPVWCLAIDHPSSGRFSWSEAHQLIRIFLDEPRDAATLLQSHTARGHR
jgi:hypothetical protein